MELDAGRADAPAGAGTAAQSSNGRGVRAGGVGVGANRREVVDPGAVVGEGVDRGEGALCSGQMAPALGLRLAPGPGRRLPGVRVFRRKEGRGRGCAVRPLSEAPPGRVVNRGGRVGQKNFPPAGRRVSAGFLLRPHERSVHGGCGGPVLDVEVAYLSLVAGVVVRHLRVVGRRRDHDDPERGACGRRDTAGCRRDAAPRAGLRRRRSARRPG